MAGLFGKITAGFLRKTQPELLDDLNTHLKDAEDEKGFKPFSGCTTLDDPVAYAGDPLVELGMAVTGSTHELYEDVECLLQNMDPAQASGAYLDTMHACAAGVTRNECERDGSFRRRICNRRRPGYPRMAGQALTLPGVDGAELLNTPYPPKVGTGEAMLIVKGGVTTDELGDLWHNFKPPGLTLVGEESHEWTNPLDGICHTIPYQPACRIFIDILVCGYADPCGDATLKEAAMEIIERAKEAYGCIIGQSISGLQLAKLGCDIDGVIIQSVKMRRRAPQLVYSAGGEPCEGDVSVILKEGEDAVPWVRSNVCGCCKGEIWKDEWFPSLDLRPWEYPDFDAAAFCQVREVALDGAG